MQLLQGLAGHEGASWCVHGWVHASAYPLTQCRTFGDGTARNARSSPSLAREMPCSKHKALSRAVCIACERGPPHFILTFVCHSLLAIDTVLILYLCFSHLAEHYATRCA